MYNNKQIGHSSSENILKAELVLPKRLINSLKDSGFW